MPKPNSTLLYGGVQHVEHRDSSTFQKNMVFAVLALCAILRLVQVGLVFDPFMIGFVAAAAVSRFYLK